MTPRIGLGEQGHAALADRPGYVRDFSREQGCRLFGLRDVVDTRAAAAPGSLWKLHKLQVWDAFKQFARLAHHLLPVRKVAGIVVRDSRLFFKRPCAGFPKSSLQKPLVDVADLAVPQARPLHVIRVVGEQRRVLAQMRTASSGIGDDRVDISRWNQVDHPAGEKRSELVLPVVRV